MKQLKYDVAIIGSGLGGLTAGALLAKAGFKTLIVEKLPFIGGRCATLDYQGFKLSTGVAMVYEEIHGALCKEVGAEFEVRLPRPLYFFRMGGKDYEAPEAGLLTTMIAKAARDEGEVQKVRTAFKRALIWHEPSCSMSLYDWLQQYTQTPAVRGIFQWLTEMGTGINDFELPAGEFFRFVKETSFVKRIGFPPLAGGSVSGSLAKAIEKMGGDVWASCRVLQIKVANGVASGMVIRKESEDIEVSAQAIVCDAAPRICLALAGRHNFDAGFVADVEATKGAPQVVLDFTANKPLLDKHIICLPEGKRVFMVVQFNDYCPEMAPKGKWLLNAVAFVGNSNPPYDFQKEYALMLQDLRENIPNFDRDATMIRVNWYYGDWGLMRIWPGHKTLPITTPVLNLYLTGDSSAPPGWWGSSAAVKSGRLVAEDIKRRYEPT